MKKRMQQRYFQRNSHHLVVFTNLWLPSQNTDDGEVRDSEEEETSRYKVVISQYDPKTGERSDIEKAIPKPKPPVDENRAFTFRKFSTGEDVMKISSSEAIIESDDLKRLLGEVTHKYWKEEKVDGLSSPYTTFIHCWDAAERLANNEEDGDSDEKKRARTDLKELLFLISTSSGNERVEQYFKDRDALRESSMITFNSLWTIFPRGTELVGRPFQGEKQLFWVQQSTGADSYLKPDDVGPLSINCFSYDWDGTELNRVPYQVTIEKFEEKKYIYELPYYPLQYHQDDSTNTTGGPDGRMDNSTAIQRLEEELQARGEKFWEYSTLTRGNQMLRYEGIGLQENGVGTLFRSNSSNFIDDETTYDSDPEPAKPVRASKVHVKGTVVVDFNSFYEYQSSREIMLGDMKSCTISECGCADCRKKHDDLARYSWDKEGRIDKDQERKWKPSPNQLRFLPPRALGYALEQKRWLQLNVNGLTAPPKANRKTFDNKLQLDASYKSLIKRSVEAHSMSKTHNIVDYTPEKGKGLVILLWGKITARIRSAGHNTN